MRIYVLLGHPDKESFNGALADAYVEEAIAEGHIVRRHNVGDLAFDPILHHGYNQIQDLEPDLVEVQRSITWCERWVIFYPIWWGSVPALLKGVFDRAILPGYGFRYHERDPMWDKLLTGRSAQVFTTSDAPNIWTLLAYRNSDLGTVKNATLKFCGVRPVKAMRFDRMKDSTAQMRRDYLTRVRSAVPRARARRST